MRVSRPNLAELENGSGSRLPSRVARRGATAVEFAVVSGVLFLLVLGIFELTRGIMVRHQLNNAALLGCRKGVVEAVATSSINTVVDTYLKASKVAGYTTTVKVNGSAADASTAKPNDEITVVITVPVSKVTWVPGGKYLAGGTLSGQCSMRRE